MASSGGRQMMKFLLTFIHLTQLTPSFFALPFYLSSCFLFKSSPFFICEPPPTTTHNHLVAQSEFHEFTVIKTYSRRKTHDRDTYSCHVLSGKQSKCARPCLGNLFMADWGVKYLQDKSCCFYAFFMRFLGFIKEADENWQRAKTVKLLLFVFKSPRTV